MQNCSRQHCIFHYYFSEEIQLDISCEWSVNDSYEIPCFIFFEKYTKMSAAAVIIAFGLNIQCILFQEKQ